MKRYLYLLLILFVFPTYVYAEKEARDEFALSCDKIDNINVNEQIVCRVSTNSNYNFNEINFNIPDINGLEVVDVRSNNSKDWKITSNDNKVSAVSSELQSGLQEFGIILLKAVKSGVYDLSLEDIILLNNVTNDSKNIDNIKESTKIISTDNLLKGIYINDSTLDNFDSNNTYYEYYVDDEDTIKISAEASNEFSVIDGVGEFELDINSKKEIFPIKVTSEDGSVKIYTINVIKNNYKDNNINKDLESILIKNDKGNNLLINFSPDIYEYNFDVDISTLSLEIKPVLSDDSLSFVKGFGEQKIEVNSGANIVIIKVKDEDDQVNNYVLNITKPIANKSSNNYIKSLIIKKYKLSFSKRVKNYTLEINANDKSLDIVPTLESDKASYIITGNNNLKDGSVIKITVTAENEEKQVYKINIKVKKTNYTGYIVFIIGIVLVIFLLNKYKKQIVKYASSIKKNNKSKQTTKKPVKKAEPVIKNKPKNSNNKKSSNVKNKQTVKKAEPVIKNKPKTKSNTKTNNKSNVKKTSSNKKSTNTKAKNNTYKPKSYTKSKPSTRKKTGKTNYKKKK